jgi:hypothetical protein
MSNLTPQQYYENESNWGSYQYVTLADIVNNFMLMYVGNDKMVANVKRYQILFHAKQAIKLLNIDAFRLTKSLELNVHDNLKFILPPDYVNYVKIYIEHKGGLRLLAENRRPNSATHFAQDNDGTPEFYDPLGNVITSPSELDTTRLTQSLYTGPGPFNGDYGYCFDDNWYFTRSTGGAYGMQTDEITAGPTFRIQNGVIDFSSNAENNTIVLEYISDGMENGDDSLVQVNKLAEEFVYRYIKWCILNSKYGVPMYEKKMAKDEKQAEFRNAKIRMSNMHPSRLLISLRGQNKIIK